MNLGALLDVASVAIVFGGTLAATILRSGRSELTASFCAAASLFRRKFDHRLVRAELASDIEDLRHDGLLRGRDCRTSDPEIAYILHALIHDRSVASLVDAHNHFRSKRLNLRELAVRPLHLAGELAPVAGLAGTLIALAQMSSLSHETGGIMVAVSGAVLTTLYGLVIAHGIFFPLARLIERRGEQEDLERQKLVDWIAGQLGHPSPSKPGSRRLESVK